MRATGISLASGYSSLPEHFYARLSPVPVGEPRLIALNRPLAAELGLDVDGLDDDRLAALFAGNWIPPGATPIAMAYAGHQFGFFVPQLGDGRAILLGEVCDVHGVRRDIQLKGSGPTPYSRSGDGRAALGPVLREYLVSEAMAALGIPATRALAAVATGEPVYREQALPGAILTRVAASHVRVGTFQYFASRGDLEATRRLADYVIDRHYPDAKESARPIIALLRAVTERQALLIARWMHVGFIHGVMNTDNMAISGETIDFGPCAFLDAYDPAKVFSSIDSHGRYAYSNQVHAGGWNLARFAETLLPLIDPVKERAIELATEALAVFAPSFEEHWLAGMRRKIGLMSSEDADLELIDALLAAMHRTDADFTLTFRRLCDGISPPACDEWAAAWRARIARDPQTPPERAAAMRRVNPAYIPRNHRIEQVIVAATVNADFSPFRELLRVLADPYDEKPGLEAYMNPPLPGERVLRTFCGT
jgi:serine/tyrosine/threonine adenylyltransferase